MFYIWCKVPLKIMVFMFRPIIRAHKYSPLDRGSVSGWVEHGLLIVLDGFSDCIFTYILDEKSREMAWMVNKIRSSLKAWGGNFL